MIVTRKRCYLVKRFIKMAKFFNTHNLTRRAPHKAWARVLAWQIKSRLRHQVRVRWISGLEFEVRHGMTGATGNLYTGLHEFPDMMVPLHFLRPGDLFLDIGANIGSYTLLASGISGADTLAFEPAPETVEILNRNIVINDLQSRVHACALGADAGEVPFTANRPGSNRVGPASDGMRMVQQTTLDSIVAGSHPVMIKIDVEEYEEQVFKGGVKRLIIDFSV